MNWIVAPNSRPVEAAIGMIAAAEIVKSQAVEEQIVEGQSVGEPVENPSPSS
jgi:hypothetical protein